LPQTKVEMVLAPPIVNEAIMKSSNEIAALTNGHPDVTPAAPCGPRSP
jgi:hypothetical protein